MLQVQRVFLYNIPLSHIYNYEHNLFLSLSISIYQYELLFTIFLYKSRCFISVKICCFKCVFLGTYLLLFKFFPYSKVIFFVNHHCKNRKCFLKPSSVTFLRLKLTAFSTCSDVSCQFYPVELCDSYHSLTQFLFYVFDKCSNFIFPTLSPYTYFEFFILPIFWLKDEVLFQRETLFNLFNFGTFFLELCYTVKARSTSKFDAKLLNWPFLLMKCSSVIRRDASGPGDPDSNPCFVSNLNSKFNFHK